MILLYTDFGWNGPYVGQMKTVLSMEAPGIPVIDLMHDAPTFNAYASAYLLASLAQSMPENAVICGVVDPGVGSDRPPVVLKADGRWFVGPGNGLFEIIARQADESEWYRLDMMPDWLSSTFHGRDLFAPTVARLARGDSVPMSPLKHALPGSDWPCDLKQVVYIDSFGNAITGIRSSVLTPKDELIANGDRFRRSNTYSDLPPGSAFWYENANGLVEIAVNQGSAEQRLAMHVGVPVTIIRH